MCRRKEKRGSIQRQIVLVLRLYFVRRRDMSSQMSVAWLFCVLWACEVCGLKGMACARCDVVLPVTPVTMM